MGNKVSKPLAEKNLWGVEDMGETPILTGEFVGETHRVLEHTQNHPARNQHQEGSICLWVVEEMTESQWRAEQWHCSLSDHPPHIQCHNQATWLPHPGEYLRLRPLIGNRHMETKKYGPNERTDQSSKKKIKIQVSNEDTVNLSDAQFKTLVIRMLTEMVEYGNKIEEKVKAMKSEIKENLQGTNSKGKETGTQINGVDQKEEINIPLEHNE